MPHRYFTHSGRSRLLHTAGRVAIGGLAKKEDGKFGDVLFADTLTSFAKPISEIYIVFCMIFTGQKATEGTDRSCGSWFWVPSLMCWPFFIRFIQCWGDHQVANAWKYATGIIAIILSAIQVDSTSGAEMDVLLHYWWSVAHHAPLSGSVIANRDAGYWQLQSTLPTPFTGTSPKTGISHSSHHKEANPGMSTV